MFDINISETEEENLPCKPNLKKKKVESEPIHSSLCYESITAPPLIEYKNLDSYCENKLGQSALPSYNDEHSKPSTSGLNNVKSISSPIVLKTSNLLPQKNSPPTCFTQPHMFLSVEEMSLVKNLKNWTNTKVCSVGSVSFDDSTEQCYLRSGHWKILLDMSSVNRRPNSHEPVQVYGTIEVREERPRLNTRFFRNLATVDLNLFTESYKLMQKYIPQIEFGSDNDLRLSKEGLEQSDVVAAEPSKTLSKTGASTRTRLNDTLDNYDFSSVM